MFARFNRVAAAVILTIALCMMHVQTVHSAAQVKPDGDLIIINKRTNQLAYFQQGVLIKQFPVATGRKPSLTPEGTFRIVNKIKNRPYYKDKIPGGDPRNPLGDRWLGLEVNRTYGTTYAIHGNNNPKSIGKYVSAGCVRMHNEDIHWLYDQVPKFTVVIILSSKKAMQDIAEASGYPVSRPYLGNVAAHYLDVIEEVELPLVYRNQKLFVPYRQWFELMGVSVEWDETTKSLTADDLHLHIHHQANTAVVTLLEKPIKLSAPSYMHKGTLYLPLRDAAQWFQVQLGWDARTSTLQLHTSRSKPQGKALLEVEAGISTEIIH